MKVLHPRGGISESGHPSRPMFVWMSQISDIANALVSSGTTADRPTKFLFAGRTYFDTTLGYPIWHDGSGWVNSAGTTV